MEIAETEINTKTINRQIFFETAKKKVFREEVYSVLLYMYLNSHVGVDLHNSAWPEKERECLRFYIRMMKTGEMQH